MPHAYESTGQVLALAVERSQPSPDKPKPGGPDTEAILKELDLRNAQCYADAELKIHRFNKLARVIDESDAAPLSLVEGDSLVHHLEDFRYKAEKLASGDDD
jgi:hypothetical protein